MLKFNVMVLVVRRQVKNDKNKKVAVCIAMPNELLRFANNHQSQH